MKNTYRRRLGAALAVPALAAGALVAAPGAQAAPATPQATSVTSWLAKQLTNGTFYNQQYTYEDFGLGLDIFFALNELGAQKPAADSIIARLQSDPSAYIGGGSAGSVGKLALAVQLAGGTADDFGGSDLVDLAETRIVDSGDEAGRGVDSGSADYSNTIGQSLLVRALDNAESSETQAAVDYLLRQQCPDGSFRANLFAVAVPDDPETSWDDSVAPVDRDCGDTATPDDDEISVDATVFAIDALTQSGDDEAAQHAIAWLKTQQAADGSFAAAPFAGSPAVANANSTGLAAATLAEADETTAAEKAAVWVAARQVKTPAPAKLAGDVGAIAYTPSTYTEGVEDGIVTNTRDSWVRASAQAAVATNLLKTLKVTTTTTYVKGGKRARVTVAGVEPGGKYTVQLGSRKVTGTANGSGAGRVDVVTPKSTATRAVTATNAAGTRVGSASVKILGKVKLKPRLAKSRVKRGKTQRVTVKGLAPRERVRIYVSGKRVKTGTATAGGNFTARFKVKAAQGKRTIKVAGQFANRSGSKTFRVR